MRQNAHLLVNTTIFTKKVFTLTSLVVNRYLAQQINMTLDAVGRHLLDQLKKIS